MKETVFAEADLWEIHTILENADKSPSATMGAGMSGLDDRGYSQTLSMTLEPRMIGRTTRARV